MLCYDSTLPMHPHKGLTSEDFGHMEDVYHIQFKHDLLSHNWLKLYVTTILKGRYAWTNVKNIVDAQHHLTASQKCNLHDVLN